jgi:nitrite reductase/ring-hydroxylating ferredoxin subunit
MTLRFLRATPTGRIPDGDGRSPARRRRNPLRLLPEVPRDRLAGTWREARPARIRRSFLDAQSRDPGGWHVVGASTEVGADRSVPRTAGDREIVLWRAAGRLMAGPGTCPHLGALLDDCEVMNGRVHCRWHGLELGQGVRRDWPTFATNDDGVLLWVRLPTDGEVPTEAPTLPVRPPRDASFATVVTLRGTCEPSDVIANRLDPWHGTWYHPYAFSHLTVDDAASTDDRLVVDVAFRVTRRYAVPVRAEFTCPDARSIVMTIVDGEGECSVVETHATLVGHDRSGRPTTVVTEATIAHSDRKGFAVARALSPLLRPAVASTARRLWVDDLAYAERRWLLRDRGETFGY